MRLYALLPIALFCVAAHSATIPELAATVPDVKLDSQLEDKIPVHDDEHLEHANITNDLNNELRLKPAEFPVEIVAEKVEPVLKTSAEKEDSEDIVRLPIDLNNPGIPQRQEHNSQSHEIYAAEIDLVEIYKKNIIKAQTILRQGLQDMTDDVENIFEKNQRAKIMKQSIQSLRDGFVAEINKLDGTIRNKLNTNTNSPSEKETEAHLEQLTTGLNVLKSEFTKRVNTIADSVDNYVALRAEHLAGEKPASFGKPSSTNPVQDYVMTMRQLFENFTFPWSQPQQISPGDIPHDAVQFDSESAAPSAPWSNIWPPNNPFTNLFGQGPQNDEQTQQTGEIGSGNGPFVQALNTIQNIWQSATGQSQPVALAKPIFSGIEDRPNETTQFENNPVIQSAEANVETQNEQIETTTLGPIRQILQKNPITHRIIVAVQALQNLNNPDKPKEPVNEKPAEPMKEKPDAPMNEKPGEPMNEKPVEPMNLKPVESMMEKPDEPMMEKPVEPVKEKPVQPMIEKPVEQTVTKPIEPFKERPAAPVYEKPLEDKNNEQWTASGNNIIANGIKEYVYPPEFYKETLLSVENKPHILAWRRR